MKRLSIFRHFAIVVVAITSILSLSSFTTSTKVEESSNKDFIHAIVDELKKSLPMDAGGGLVMTDAYLTSSYFVFEYTCSDTIIDLTREGMKQLSKGEMIQSSLSDESAALLAKLCMESNYGMRMIFVNQGRSNVLEMSYSLSDLKTYLNK
jgi:hypothetical protein